MLSYNCLELLCKNENNLLQHIKQIIIQMEFEISHINALIQETNSLQLTPWDLDYYNKELNDILQSNVKLLHYFTSFLNNVYELVSIDKL